MTRPLLLAAALLAPRFALAAPFVDPTRPPLIEVPSAPAGQPLGPRLESVLIAPDRRIAVINGQQLTVGGKVSGSEVVRITESEVVLRGTEGTQTLKLVPEFAKRAPSAPEKRTKK
jgi:MSHA biogenesis protein MshK